MEMWKSIVLFTLYGLSVLFLTIKILRFSSFKVDRSRRARAGLKSISFICLYFCIGAIVEIYLAGFALLSTGMEMKYLDHYAFFMISPIIIQMIIILVKVIMRLAEYAKNEEDPRKQIFNLIGLIMTPNIVFGSIYSILSNDTLEPVQGLYFAFAINYSLPLQTDVYVLLQKSVNENTLLMLLQMSQIVISRITELVLIGYIVSKLTDVIGKNQVSRNES